jgi:hypothetical protein
MKCRFWILLSTILFISGSAKAQLTVFAGPQMSSAKYSLSEVKQETEYKTGFMAGVGLKTVIEGPAYFTPLMYYSKKGYKVTFNRPGFPPDSAAKNNNTSINTIELAPLIQINLSKSANYFFLRFGPSFDINISGHEGYDSTNNKRVERAMPFGFGEYGYVTAAANIQLGYQLKTGISIFAHYAHGIGNLNNADNGPVILHRIAGISVGWRLHGKN